MFGVLSYDILAYIKQIPEKYTCKKMTGGKFATIRRILAIQISKT